MKIDRLCFKCWRELSIYVTWNKQAPKLGACDWCNKQGKVAKMIYRPTVESQRGY